MNERAQLLMIKGAIMDMTEEEQQQYKEAKLEFDQLVMKHKDAGVLALAVVTLEQAILAESEQ